MPVGQHRALPLQGSLWGVLCSCRTCASALQGTPFLGNSSGERFLPEVNVRAPFAQWYRDIHGFVSFAFLLIPNPSLAPWKCCWGCGAWAVQPLLDPRGDPGLGTGKQKGFGWPPVGLRLLWLCPLCTALVAAGCVPTAQGRSWKCFLWFLWPLAAHLGDFHPQDTAAPWDTARGCRKGCRKLLLRLVLPWDVGTALGCPCAGLSQELQLLLLSLCS